MCLIEAAACGRPIITTDIPGCREIVRHEENGLLVPVKNPLELAEAIRRLIDNPDQRKAMGYKGRELVEERFSEERVAKETLNLYRAMLGSDEH